jgi:hypothetical protein
MKSKFIYVSIFAIAMAFLETSVVIYLRELMYPVGFDFPLAPISPELAITEILREAATLIMLVMIGVLAAKSFAEGFAWFLYSFAIWDIFYYVFLKLLINWPESIMTWDILFLIPATWTGPVLTPLLVSLMMIFLAVILIKYTHKKQKVVIKVREWLGLIAGSIILVLSFILDYSTFILQKYSVKEIFSLPDKSGLYEYAIGYVPAKFPWVLFISGYLFIFSMIILMWKRFHREQSGK